MNIEELKQRALTTYPEIIALSPAERALLDAYLNTHRIHVTLSRLQSEPHYRDEIERLKAEHRRLRMIVEANRQAAPPEPPAVAAPTVGFLRVEDVRPAYPDLSEDQVERVRKRLEEWRKLNEDSVLIFDEDAGTGRKRYAYPGDVVRQKVQDMLAQEQRRPKR